MNTQTTEAGWRDRALAVAYLDGLLDPVVVLDAHSLVREGNDAFAQFVALDKARILNQPIAGIAQLVPWLAPFVAAVQAMAQKRKADRVLLNLTADRGSVQTLLLTGIPMKLAGETDLLAVRVENITAMVEERAQIEAERIAARDSALSLERLNEELEGFSYSVAHDLRAPLRFIDKFAYLLMEHHSHELSSQSLQYAEQIREGTRQMAQLVEDLLQFSQVTGQELTRQDIDMTLMAQQVVAKAEHDIEDRDVEFHIADLGTAQGDPALVRQVLANLIGNAAKFTRFEKKSVIEITRSPENDPPIFTVSDNGVGFDASEADRLFTVFQRFHQPDQFEGSGVGLAVVKRVVNRHGGMAWAESRPGEGAHFHFTLAPSLHEHGR